ncbi:hypothetical protein ACEQPO_18335 [Bacillus sp. SL00103]
MADAFFNRSFLDPAVKGHFQKKLVEVLKKEGFMPSMQKGDLELTKRIPSTSLNQLLSAKKSERKEHMLHPMHHLCQIIILMRLTCREEKMNVYRGWEI